MSTYITTFSLFNLISEIALHIYDILSFRFSMLLMYIIYPDFIQIVFNVKIVASMRSFSTENFLENLHMIYDRNEWENSRRFYAL